MTIKIAAAVFCVPIVTYFVRHFTYIVLSGFILATTLPEKYYGFFSDEMTSSEKLIYFPQVTRLSNGEARN